VQELAGKGTALAILPQGTANNFATALRLPLDLPSAFRVIAEGDRREVDLGRANGVYFAEAAGVGIFADLLAVSRAGHGFLDVMRVVGMLLKAWIANQPRRLTLVLDGERQAQEVLNVTVANTFAVGYNIPIAPTARLTDEQLDVVVVEALDRHEMLAYYRAIRAQLHLDLPKVKLRRAREVRIEARHRQIVHIDDRARWRTPITAVVEPRALSVLVDRP
jgi:diacylglycerol kinase (ATP)